MPVVSISADVKIGGTSYGSKVVSVLRDHHLTQPGQVVTIEFDRTAPHASWNPWNTLEVIEQGSTVLTGFVDQVIISRAPSLVTVKGRDTYKRANDWFIHHNLTTEGETISYWVGQLCNLCGLSYSIDTSGSSNTVGVGLPIGLRSVADALTSMIAFAGWQMRVSADGVLHFIGLATLGTLDYTLTDLQATERTRSDETARNVVKVWGYNTAGSGMSTTGSGGRILYKETREVPGIENDRIMLWADQNIRTEVQAQALATAALDQFASMEHRAVVEIPANQAITVGQVAKFTDEEGDFQDKITDQQVRMSRQGYIETLNLGRRSSELAKFPVETGGSSCVSSTELWLKSGESDTGAYTGVSVASNFVLMAAKKTSNNSTWLRKYNATTSALIWAVDTGLTNSSTTAMGIRRHVYYDTQAAYIATLDTNSGGWKIQRREINFGSLVWEATSPDTEFTGTQFNGLWGNTDGVFLVGSIRDADQPGSSLAAWRIEKRNKNSGGLLWTVQDDNPDSTQTSDAYDVVSDGQFIYVSGEETTTSYSTTIRRWRVEKRFAATGDLVWRVFFDGSQLSGILPAVGIAAYKTGLYVVGRRDTTPVTTRVRRLSTTDGSEVWVKTYTTETTAVADIAVGPRGVYFVTNDIRLRKLDYNGNTVWTSLVVGGTLYSVAHYLQGVYTAAGSALTKVCA